MGNLVKARMALDCKEINHTFLRRRPALKVLTYHIKIPYFSMSRETFALQEIQHICVQKYF